MSNVMESEVFDVNTLSTFTSESIPLEVGSFAKQMADSWSNYARAVAPDLDVPELEIQNELESPFDIHSDTYDRVATLVNHLSAYLNIAKERFAPLVRQVPDIHTWKELVEGYNDPHWPVLGVMSEDTRDLLLIWDPRNYLEVRMSRSSANDESSDQHDNTMFFRITDRYREIAQIVSVKEMAEDKRAMVGLSAYKYKTANEFEAVEGATMRVEQVVEMV